jgi:hypothetical protein
MSTVDTKNAEANAVPEPPPIAPDTPLSGAISDSFDMIKGTIDANHFDQHDYAIAAEALEEFVFGNYGEFTRDQRKQITLHALTELQGFVAPYISEEASAGIAAAALLAPTLFDIIEKALLKQFDANGDGKISPQECCPGCFGGEAK